MSKDSPSELAKVFPGAKGIYDELHSLYPRVHDPVQLNTLIKYWQGGPDPLDYISAYPNPGNPQINVPPHWHFISYGLTDLHGDGRVHIVKNYPLIHEKSGYGFELTFRLKKECDEVTPPVWPARLMQQLAKYVFSSGNPLIHGDHVSWHQSLDGGESRIQHMIMFKDPQVRPVTTCIGTVDFVQIVGVTNEELETVQQWNGPSFLEVLRRYPHCGGDHLVTDMRRGESLFEIDPNTQEEINDGINRDGSNLSGVTAHFEWCDDAWRFYNFDDLNFLTPDQRERYFGMQRWEEAGLENENEVENKNNDYKNELFNNNRPFAPANCEDDDDDEHDENSPAIVPTSKSVSSLRSSMGENVIEDITNQQNISNSLKKSVEEMRMSCGSTHSQSITMECMLGEIDAQIESFDSMHLSLNLEAALIIPLALKGRVKHGRHFTFKDSHSNRAITLVAPTVRGSYSNAEFPYRCRGYWLQIYLESDLVDKILQDFDALMATEALSLPKTILWAKWSFALTITL